MASDVNYISPRDYTHWHKSKTMPTGWNIMVQVEANIIKDPLQPMVEGYDRGAKNIYREHSNSTWYNHFSGNQILDWLGENGSEVTMTRRRDSHIYELPSK